jgi:hypothetical protein
MGLNSCWVALTYGKGKVLIKKAKGQKILCLIAFGYGATTGFPHHSKSAEEVSKSMAKNQRIGIKASKPPYLLQPQPISKNSFSPIGMA